LAAGDLREHTAGCMAEGYTAYESQHHVQVKKSKGLLAKRNGVQYLLR